METYVHIKTHIRMSIAALFVKPKLETIQMSLNKGMGIPLNNKNKQKQTQKQKNRKQ